MMKLINLVFFSLLLITWAPAQKEPEIMTNAKVIELVRLGLGDSLIVAKIKQSKCDCDTSTAALGRLKAAKVSDAVIMAMMNSGANDKGFSNTAIQVPLRNPEKPINTPNRAADLADAEGSVLSQIRQPGIYMYEGGELTAIEPSVFSGSKVNPLISGITYGIKKSSFKAKVRGRSANLQTANTRPIFYFVFDPNYGNSGATMAGNAWLGLPATSPNEFMLVQMKANEASREAVLGEYGVWTGMKTGARDKDVREYSFEKIRTGVYKVVPKTPLAPGEYCFYYAGNVQGFGISGGKIFDFSVR